MSIFDRLERIASRTVDATNAIPFIFSPMRATPNGRPGYDPDRPIVEGRGVFDMVPAPVPVEFGARSTAGGGNALRSLVNGEEPSLSVDRRLFPELAREPRQGDVIEFPTRPDLGPFEVVECRRDGLSRMVVRLVKLG